MRIAMISMHTSPLNQPGSGDAGGMNVYVYNTARELALRGHSVDVFTRATRPSQGEIVIPIPGLAFRVINIVAGPYDGLSKEALPTQLAAFAGGIINFLACQCPESTAHTAYYDLIHAHYWLSGQVGWLLRDLWRIPLVVTFHTLAAVKNAHRPGSESPETEARRLCEQQIVDNADMIIVNTALEERDLRYHYDAHHAERIEIVPPGANIDLFTPGNDRATERARRELGVPLQAKVIAFVGRLQTFKGPQVLLRAVAEIMRNHPDFPLRVLLCGGASGADTAREDYPALVREYGLEQRVRFLDPRPPEELVSVYRAADIVAVPSYNESFGLVAIEAQATGTPVVAARVGGLPVVVLNGETGVLVDTHDPQDWADALYSLLLDDPTRESMARAAAQHAADFSWAKCGALLEKIYEQLPARSDHPCQERYGGGEITVH